MILPVMQHLPIYFIALVSTWFLKTFFFSFCCGLKILQIVNNGKNGIFEAERPSLFLSGTFWLKISASASPLQLELEKFNLGVKD